MLTDVQKKITRSMWRYLPKLSSASLTYGMLRPFLVFPKKFSRKAAIRPIVRKIRYLSFQIWYCVLFSLIFHSSGHCKAKKKICLFMVTCQKNLGSVCIKFFFFTIGKTGNSRSRFCNPIPVFDFRNFWISRHHDENTQFFYLLCSTKS